MYIVIRISAVVIAQKRYEKKNIHIGDVTKRGYIDIYIFYNTKHPLLIRGGYKIHIYNLIYIQYI